MRTTGATASTAGETEETAGFTRAGYFTGALAGLVAGAVMSMGMMLIAILRGESPWGMPNMIATMWLGVGAADGGLGVATMFGLVTHMATSALMGVVAVPFVAGLARWRVLLVSLAYALASYPLVFSLVIRWANPLMYERAPMFDMTWGHAVFGVTFAVAFLWIGDRRDRPHRQIRVSGRNTAHANQK